MYHGYIMSDIKFLKSRDNVYYTLEHSPYTCKIGNWVFYFSAESRFLRFITIVDAEVDRINESLSTRFNLTVDVPDLGYLSAYRKAESRGFYAKFKNEVLTWQTQVKLNGTIEIIKNSKESEKIGTQRLND